MTKSRGINRPCQRWTEDQLETLRINYANWPTYLVAHVCDHTEASTYQKARELGLKKSPEYLAKPESGRLQRNDNRGGATRFKKGCVPANKGLRRPGWAPGRMADGQFRKGERRGVAVKLYQPIGAERISKDGYLERKVNDDLPLQARWRAVHLLRWEGIHGRVPPGHALVFRDGNKSNTAPENMELISRGELMRRNTIHRYPDELKQVIRLQGKLRRTIANKTENAAP